MRAALLLSVVVLGALAASVAQAAWPQSRIDDIARAAERAGATRIVGIEWSGRYWEVEHVQNNRLMEWRLSDATRKILRRENQPEKPLTARLNFRQALAATRRIAPGTVLTLELDRDNRLGVIWQSKVREARDEVDLSLDGNTGKLLKMDRERPLRR